MRRMRPTLRPELPAPGYRRSTTVTAQPRRRSSIASTRPAMPAPTTTTLRIGRERGEGHRPCRRPRGRGRRVGAERAQLAEHRSGAELALARPGHGAGAALDELRAREALGDARAQVAEAHVLAE